MFSSESSYIWFLVKRINNQNLLFTLKEGIEFLALSTSLRSSSAIIIFQELGFTV